MKTGLAQNLSANSLQLVVNQIFGVVIFYILSVHLTKDGFGQLNLALAILMSSFNILSLGIDQVAVKKIASGEDTKHVLSLYIFHVLLAGFAYYGVLLLGKAFFFHGQQFYGFLLLMGIGKLMNFFSTPLKQVSAGMERFRLLSSMFIVSNLFRAGSLIALAFLHKVDLHRVILIFIAGDALDLGVSIFLFKIFAKISITPKWDKLEYKALLLQSLPQVGVVLITSTLARFDWLFIGFIGSAIQLAEYSFAYKIFEISTLPLLAIAPLLIPRFTKLFKTGDYIKTDFKFLIRIEMAIAALTALLLNMCWEPIIDPLTHGKYGAVNVHTIFLLSLCLPFMYFNNFLWTVFFAQGKMKLAFYSFLTAFCVNVLGDVILIPIFKNEGAAFAFLLSCLAQSLFYIYKNELPALKNTFYSLLICIACAMLSGVLAKILVTNNWLATLLSVAFYVTLLFISTQLKRSDGKSLQIALA